jgi:hypothetical protein
MAGYCFAMYLSYWERVWALAQHEEHVAQGLSPV